MKVSKIITGILGLTLMTSCLNSGSGGGSPVSGQGGYTVYANHMYVATTSGLSLSKDSGSSWTQYTTPDLANNLVYKVRVFNNKVYIATQAGLTITDQDFSAFESLTTTDGLASNVIHDVCVSNTHIYVSTTSGLSTSSDDGATWVTTTTADGIRENNIYSLDCDNQKVYIGSPGGLTVSTDANATAFTDVGFAGTEDIVKLASGRVMVAHTGGIHTIDPSNFVDTTLFADAPTISNNEVKSIALDGNKVHIAIDNTTSGGYSYTDDDGSNWVLNNSGFSNLSTRSVAAKGDLVMITTVFETGVSTDGGASFIFYGSAEGVGNSGKSVLIHAWPVL